MIWCERILHKLLPLPARVAVVNDRRRSCALLFHDNAPQSCGICTKHNSLHLPHPPRRRFATKRQLRAKEMTSKLTDGSKESTSVVQKNPFPDIHTEGMSSVDGENVETHGGFTVDTSGLYQPDMHNFLPDFNDPKLNYEESTPVWEELSSLIGLRGPISVAEYFRYALLHPEHGYYTVPPAPLESIDSSDFDDDSIEEYDLIGARGDFTTAPEISQIFGELLCVHFVHEWKRVGEPSPIQMVELGAGNGTLMHDILRVVTSSFPDFASALRHSGGGIRLVERSQALRRAQSKKLKLKDVQSEKFYNSEFEDARLKSENESSSRTDYIEYLLSGRTQDGIEVTWHMDLSSVPNEPSSGPQYLVAQELFDALPVHSFQKTNNGWRERLIDLASNEEEECEESDVNHEAVRNTAEKKPRLRFVLSPGTTRATRTLLNTDKSGKVKGENNEKDDASDGDIVEVCPEGMSLVQDMTKRINKCGGGALIIDYGSDVGTGDTIRGFSKHKQVHLLSLPGKVDVTADVDFNALKYAVHQVEGHTKPFGPMPQGQFLVSLGAVERVEALISCDTTSEEQAENLYSAFETLVLPEKMGKRFKVLALSSEQTFGSDHIPPGFI